MLRCLSSHLCLFSRGNKMTEISFLCSITSSDSANINVCFPVPINDALHRSYTAEGDTVCRRVWAFVIYIYVSCIVLVNYPICSVAFLLYGIISCGNSGAIFMASLGSPGSLSPAMYHHCVCLQRLI